MGRPVLGDVNLAKQLILETDKTDYEIADESGCAISKVKLIRKECEPKPQPTLQVKIKPYIPPDEPIVYTEESMPRKQPDEPSQSKLHRATKMVERIATLKSEVLEIVSELDSLKSELQAIADSEAKMVDAIRSFVELVG